MPTWIDDRLAALGGTRLLPRAEADAIIAHARAEHPRECCGLLAAEGGAVVKHYPITNVYAGNDFFEMESHEQRAALDEIWEERGWDLLAIYHSHPASAPVPSRKDLDRNSCGETMVHVIVGLANDEPDVRAWWLTETKYRPAEYLVS